MALGSETGSSAFQRGTDAFGATSRIIERGQSGIVQMSMARGAELVEAGSARAPNVINIDTEGFELEVLLGLGELLREPTLRALCIEVHYGLLAERGLSCAPAQIEEPLGASGFAISWPDASHIVAERRSA